MDFLSLKEHLNNFGQAHLLEYYNELDSEQKEILLNQISSIDFSILKDIETYKSLNKTRGQIAPIQTLQINKISQNIETYENIGLDSIKQGKVAALLLAGGQGTRFGCKYPKGMLNIGISKVLYLFEALINNMLSVVKQAGTWFPLYVMTSDKTHSETVDFFKQHNYLGYNKDYIKFFIQDMFPSVDFSGKVLMEDKFRIALSPNGNGGWFSSLVKAGLLEELKNKGVEWLNIFSVDNPLQKICDPLFIGATICNGCDCGAKVVKKSSPDERVGVMCLEDNKPSIVEYYELTNDMQNAKDEKGNYLYNFGVTLNYLFKIEKMEKMANNQLPLHIAEKKISHLSSRGSFVEPTSPNGYKIETLVLDWIHLMDSCLPYEVERNKEFAPIKNSTGTDSLETAQELLKLNDVLI